MDALESQLLIEQTRVKSPGFAAILGFFFPALAAFYTRHIAVGIAYLIVDFINLMLVIVGIGVITGFLFRLIAAYLSYSWAREINRKNLEDLVTTRKAHALQPT